MSARKKPTGGSSSPSPRKAPPPAVAANDFVVGGLVVVEAPVACSWNEFRRSAAYVSAETARALAHVVCEGAPVIVAAAAGSARVAATLWVCDDVPLGGLALGRTARRALAVHFGERVRTAALDAPLIDGPARVRFELDSVPTDHCPSDEPLSSGESRVVASYLIGALVLDGQIVPSSLYGSSVCGRVVLVSAGSAVCGWEAPARALAADAGSPIAAFLIRAHTQVDVVLPSSGAPREELARAAATRPVWVPLEAGALGALSTASYGGATDALALARRVMLHVFHPVAVPGSVSGAARRLSPPHGLLLHGPPGTGKTLLARVLAADSSAALFLLSGADVLSRLYGETEAAIERVFSEARALGRPAIVLMDEVDALAPKRAEAGSELERRISAVLALALDALGPDDRVLVIATTNRLDSVDPLLRRPGRLDRELELGVPSVAERLAVLRAQLRTVPHTIAEHQLEWLASRLHGFVGADIAALLREATIAAVRQSLDAAQAAAADAGTREPPPVGAQPAAADAATAAAAAAAAATTTTSTASTTAASTVTTSTTASEGGVVLEWAHVVSVIGAVKPSALRELTVEVPSVRWTDIGGQDEAKQAIREAVEWPLTHREAFARLGIRAPRGLLLYGPPGCSKTMLAKALATECQFNFVAIKGPELFSKWVGESEKAVRALFRRARQAAPCVIFFDEIDAMAGKRAGAGGGASVHERVLAQLLAEMDGIEALASVVVVGATNRPDKLDAALLRPGRFDRLVYIGLPDQAAREAIVRLECGRVAAALRAEDLDMAAIAARADGYSGAEVVALTREARLAAIRESVAAADPPRALPLAARHFELAFAALGGPRTPHSLLEYYARFRGVAPARPPVQNAFGPRAVLPPRPTGAGFSPPPVRSRHDDNDSASE